MGKVILFNKGKIEESTDFDLELHNIQKFLDGYMEVLPLCSFKNKRRAVMLLNDEQEGKKHELEVNSPLAHTKFGIRGNVIIHALDTEGNELPLTDEEVTEALQYVRAIK